MGNGSVLDAEAAEHYDPTALTALALAIGQVWLFVPLSLIGRPLPGRPPAERWTA